MFLYKKNIIKLKKNKKKISKNNIKKYLLIFTTKKHYLTLKIKTFFINFVHDYYD